MTPQDAYVFILGEWQDLDAWCMKHQCEQQIDIRAILFTPYPGILLPEWQRLNASDYPVRLPISMIFSDAERKTPPVRRLIIVHKRVGRDDDWTGFYSLGAEPDLAAKDHTEMLANIKLAASPRLEALRNRYPIHYPWYQSKLRR